MHIKKKLLALVLTAVMSILCGTCALAYDYGDLRADELGKVISEFDANTIYSFTAPADNYRVTYTFETTKETDFVLTAYSVNPNGENNAEVEYVAYDIDSKGWHLNVEGTKIKVKEKDTDGKEYTSGFTLPKGKHSISFKIRRKGGVAKWMLASDVKDGNFKVESAVTSLKVYILLKKGSTMNLSTVIEGADVPITYKSSNTKVATVSSKGVVTGKAAGKVSITIKAGTKTVKLYFKVS